MSALAIQQSEEWRPFRDFPYSVSNLGRVRRDKHGKGTFAGRILRPGLTSKGYPFVRLGVGNRSNAPMFTVHRMVAETFIGPCPSGMEVDHKNGVRADARAENLEYVTHQENGRRAYLPGRNPRVCRIPRHLAIKMGEANGRAKVTAAIVRAIRMEHAETGRVKALTVKYGLCRASIDYIVRRIHWSHVT